MHLTIGWLYFDLMNTYGDRGNVLTLKHRTEKRGITATIKEISTDSTATDFNECDVFMMGGAEDRQQKIVAAHLKDDIRKVFTEKVLSGTPGVYVCGAYQYLGEYYQTTDGNKIECLGIFPFYTKGPEKNAQRLIGDIVVDVGANFNSPKQYRLIGFENHMGRTYGVNPDQTLGKVMKGHGNNGDDGYEGFVSKNTIGTYLHGPILPRNPLLADFLIAKALEKKYNRPVALVPIDDALENKNREYLLKKLV